MKILYVITGLGCGGAERVVIDLADKMFELGHQVKIVFLTGKAILEPKHDDIDIIPLHLNSWIDLIPASKKYRDIVDVYRPDVIHSHMVHANLFCRLNRIVQKINYLICTAHNSNEGGVLRSIAYRLTHRLGDVMTNVSNDAVNAFLAKRIASPNEIQCIYNGIDLEKFNKLTYTRNSQSIQCISIGRLEEQKDYPNLLNAIALLKNKIDKKIHFNIIGDGILRKKIESLIAELNISDMVTLLGRRSDIPELLNQADFFILASKYEGFGLVVAEAMASKVFVISTDCGGPSEILGNTGLLVPPEDSLALSNAILAALSKSPEEIDLNNKQARERVEKLFSLEKITEQWLSLYQLGNKNNV